MKSRLHGYLTEYHGDVHATLIPQFHHRAKISQKVILKKGPEFPPEPLDD